jgi:hypothetical protein
MRHHLWAKVWYQHRVSAPSALPAITHQSSKILLSAELRGRAPEVVCLSLILLCITFVNKIVPIPQYDRVADG